MALGAYSRGCMTAFSAITFFAACAVPLHHHIITRIQSWLMSRGEAATAAAGISELLDGQDPEQVLDAARRNFSCVTADKLTFEDMKDNKPNPALAKLSHRALLGHVDAFLS